MLSFFNSKRKQSQVKSGPVRANFLQQIVFSWVGNFHNALRDDFRLLDNLKNYSVDELIAQEKVERFSNDVENIRSLVVDYCRDQNVNQHDRACFLAHLQKAAVEAQFVFVKEQLQTVKNDVRAELKVQFANLSDQMAECCFVLAELYGGSKYAHNFRYETKEDIDSAGRSTRYYHQAITYKGLGMGDDLSGEQLLSFAVHFQEMAERYAPVHANKSRYAIGNSLSAIASLQAALGSVSDNKRKEKIRLELAKRYLELAKKYKLNKSYNDQYVRDALFFANYYLMNDCSPEAVKLKGKVDFLSARYHELLHSDPLRKVQRSLRVRFNFNRFMRGLLALNVEANAIATNDKRERAPTVYQDYLCALFATKSTLYLRKLYVKLMARQDNFSEVFAAMIQGYADNDDHIQANIVSGLEALPARFLESVEKVLLERGIDAQLHYKIKPRHFKKYGQERYKKIIDILSRDIASKRLVFVESIASDPKAIEIEMQMM
ncbi:MAG: hypothetical protein KAS93_05310 [Gammaproteobacteria bacterium]|nr:hypothetical protein [Gammaproteobacteria bacterium]